MLFDVVPKERREDFYDRDEELSGILEALRLGERLVIVYGVRRIGKSSLVKVALRESKLPYVLVDVRELYYSENMVTIPYLVKYLIDGFKKYMKWCEKLGFNLRDALKRIRKVHVKGYEVEIEPKARISLTALFSEISSWCRKHGMRFVFVFDEAQYLRFSNIRYDGLFAWAVDNLSNITFILTGSEVGVLREFLRIDDARAPLYGRYRREIYVDRFSRDQSMDFLRQGFRELGLQPDMDELGEAVEAFNGLVGWLTYYGYYRVIRKLSHKEALNKVFEEGSKLVLEELIKVIAPSKKRYTAILKAIAHGITSWSDIKAYTIAKTGSITDKRFTELLKKLVKYGYLLKEDNRYKIPDPIVKYVVMEKL
ncbi:MAG: ATP-binding protein [Desulfurococcales archaeon]|nr:ATP-binding protein [Desulfurococcales archaeon]